MTSLHGLFFGLFTLFPLSLFACLGGTNSGTLNPTVAFQTQAVSNGQYYVVNVTCGNTYTFTFCSNGGTAGWDTQLTLIDNTGTTELVYSDDACGLLSQVSWTAPTSGTVRILISQYFCNNSGGFNGTMAYNMTVGSVNSSFTLTSICGGATANITGSTGGVFSWNPSNPGDGAVLNTTTGQISNAVPGSTYSITYTVCSSSTTQNVTAPVGACWTLNGNATYINVGGEQCIQLTAEVNGQTGCAWNGSQVDFSTDFTLSLDYYFGNNINGADGNTFTFQPSSATACGTAGGQLGAGAIPNALSIEFDTYDNDNPAHIYDMACDHVAIEIDGNMNGPGAPLCGPVCAKPLGQNIDDGGTYPVDIIWDASSFQLQVYFNGILRLTCTNDFITNVFGTNNVYWGVTSATGGLNNQQYFCPSTVVLPTEMSSFSSTCDGDAERIDWVTASEDRVSHFVVEHTQDGITFFPIQEVAAIGNSQSTTSYSIEVPTEIEKAILYRIKMVDIDGNYEYSSMIARKHCEENQLFSSLQTLEDGIAIGFNEKASCSIYNQLGQLILLHETYEANIFIPTASFQSGIYSIIANDGNGLIETKRVFIP